MTDETTTAPAAPAQDNTQVAIQTAVQTAEALAPAILATAAAADPRAAVALQLAPVAIQAMQSALQLAQAGAMTPEQLAALWQTVGAGVQKAHSDWEAMNAPTLPPGTVQPTTPA